MNRDLISAGRKSIRSRKTSRIFLYSRRNMTFPSSRSKRLAELVEELEEVEEEEIITAIAEYGWLLIL
jgi:hypothetical protein